jgi:hypothetical protein
VGIDDILFEGASELAPYDSFCANRPNDNVRAEIGDEDGRWEHKVIMQIDDDLPVGSKGEEVVGFGEATRTVGTVGTVGNGR